MSFPQAWADRLFAALTIRYGEAFARQWGEEVSAADIKRDWSIVLSGWEKFPEAIRWALENLPEKPVNAIGFRALCRQAPSTETAQLPPPKADPALVAEIMAKAIIKPIAPGVSPAEAVVDGIIERLTRETRMASRAQRDFLARSATMLKPNDPRRQKLRALGCSEVVAPYQPEVA